MDKIGDFLFSAEIFGRVGLIFGEGAKKRPDFISRVSWVVGVDGFFLRYAAKALAR